MARGQRSVSEKFDFGWDHRPAQEASSNPTLTLSGKKQREIIAE